MTLQHIGKLANRFAVGARRSVLASAGMLLLATSAMAVQPDEILADPALEARARAISAELRCLVCQNQSIDDSNAPLARDLRVLVRERLQTGETDAQVLQFIEDRYGEFVLLRPPLNMSTLLLWLAPILALVLAVWTTARAWRRRQDQIAVVDEAPARQTPLTPDEERKLQELLKQQGGASSTSTDQK
ncbi:Cytochrome c heme lyase subunit CcmL [Hyphomicrobium sulfonivorans]|uniref:Cytochrome c-type biogenesis protein n=2 Tax=Hyphomicrobium sulfonivorans TaxID=121290 RepID=A0A120CW70_HYPSL|nr:Cytochrome c heme lyase subunit CcmL [Hyphomicrobium sulfonivorans]